MTAALLQKCLLEYDFDLLDRFCDADELRTAWQNMEIPEPLLRFLSALLKCPGPQNTSLGNKTESSVDEIETEMSQSKLRHIEGILQVLFCVVNDGRKRTPLNVMNSQAIYESSKSATLISGFNRFGLCIGYDELMQLQNDMANYAVHTSNDTIPLPSHFDPDVFTHIAFDNFDHNEATLSGMGTSHDTVTVIFQVNNSFNHNRKPKASEAGIVHGP